MSIHDPQREAGDEVPAPIGPVDRVLYLLRWAGVHWRRTVAVLVVVVGVLIGISVSWTLTAEMTIDAEREKLDQALAALEEGQYEQARTLVRRVLNTGILPRREHGRPLFILGAVKVNDANNVALDNRQRTEYLVASRYLTEARSYGFPSGREKQGLLLLGKSLVESHQAQQGVPVLLEALDVEPHNDGPLNVAIHRVLAEAHAALPEADFEQALVHAQAVLDSQQLSPNQRTEGLLIKSSVLARLGRFDKALKTLEQVPDDTDRLPMVELARARLMLDRAETAKLLLPEQPDGGLPDELKPQVEQAMDLLNRVQAADRQDGDVTRRALYLLGRGAELQGQQRQASKLFTRTFQQFGATDEGLAAMLAEAELQRHEGDRQDALVLYRRVLESDVDQDAYRNPVLPLDRLQESILEAVADYVERGDFRSATVLIDRFPPLFTRAEQLELRGATLRRWGDWELDRARDEEVRRDERRHDGRSRLREAGVAYETLADERFDTAEYTNDIWRAADCYYDGHSFSNTARLLNLYLKHEPERQNPQALLRLGQSELSLGHFEQSTAAFEECIELYGRDNATYQARIDCAAAYRYLGQPEEAIRLLRVNLTESTLKPTSPEWRDSLFALGELQFGQGAYEDAISTLEEAVARYPDNPQTLQARYLIGESYRRWAEEPFQNLQQARTASEREKNRRLVDQRLRVALDQLKQVQRALALQAHGVEEDAVDGAMLRNCYMLEGAVLFDLGRYDEAIKAYSNVSSLYPNEPFVLETFVQIANCWQRLDRGEKASGAIEQAKLAIERIPQDFDFAATTAFSREEWRLLLGDMSQW